MARKTCPCFLCERLYHELEEAEQCERDHATAHDAWCPCERCRAERCRDAAEEIGNE